MNLPKLKGLSSDNALLVALGLVGGVVVASYLLKGGGILPGGVNAVPVASDPSTEMKFAGTGAGKLFPHMAYLNTIPTQINYPPSTALIYRLQTLNGLADMHQQGTFGPPGVP